MQFGFNVNSEASSRVSFSKLLRAFQTGGITRTDLLEGVDRLLGGLADTDEFAAILYRRELVEPLPLYIRLQVLERLFGQVQEPPNNTPALDEVNWPPDARESVVEVAVQAARRTDFNDSP